MKGEFVGVDWAENL